MNLFFDLRLRYFVETPGLDNAVSELTFKQGDGEEVVIQFGRSPDSNGPVSVVQAPTWAAESLSATGSMKIGIKAAGDYSDGDLLAGLSSFTHDAALDTYTGSLDLNTTAINTLLNASDADDTNDVASIELALFEMTFKTATGEPDRSSINDITTTIKHSVLSGTEGTPTNAGDPTLYAQILNTIQYLPSVTGMTGGTASDLDAIATVSTAVGGAYVLIDAATGRARTYELISGTTAENSPTTIRPDDYSGTNEKVYTLRDPAGSGGGIDNLLDDTTPQLGGTLDTNSKSITFSKGADIAATATLAVGTDGNQFDITGSTTIAAFSDVAIGAVIKLTFKSVRTINHSSGLLLPNGGSNIVLAAGDTGTFEQIGTGTVIWKCTSFQRFDGKALTPGLTDLSDDATPTAGGPLSMGAFQLQEAIGTDIASATSLTIPTDGNSFTVTGAVTISSFSNVAIGLEVELRFTGAPTLNHSTSLLLPSEANIVVVAGDSAKFRQTSTSVWKCVGYTRLDGTALVGAAASGTLFADGSVAGTARQELKLLNLTDGTTETIATGVITITTSIVIVAAESATSDFLTDIEGGSDGDVIKLYAAAGDTITLTSNASPTANEVSLGRDAIALSETEPLTLTRKGSVWYPDTGAASPNTQVVIIVDEKAYNVGGGTFTSGAPRVRDLNTVRAGGGSVSLVSNRFKLDAGRWLITACAPAYKVTQHWLTLYNYTQSSEISVGQISFVAAASDAQTQAVISAEFNADGTDEVELQHECKATYATYGLGIFTNTTPHLSIYSEVICRRLGN